MLILFAAVVKTLKHHLTIFCKVSLDIDKSILEENNLKATNVLLYRKSSLSKSSNTHIFWRLKYFHKEPKDLITDSPIFLEQWRLRFYFCFLLYFCFRVLFLWFHFCLFLIYSQEHEIDKYLVTIAFYFPYICFKEKKSCPQTDFMLSFDNYLSK